MMILVGILLLTILAGVWRALYGPGQANRVLAIQLFGTTGTAILLILADVQNLPALRDAALVLALLAAVVSAALVQYLRGTHSE